jgi:2-polyprenyl-6-methoxyphenol hydroxylase-like FAD-dependent oxidoreductase
MKFFKTQRTAANTEAKPAAPVDRRSLVVGAGVAGAAAVAAAVLHRQGVEAPVAADAASAPPVTEGYRVTPHVLRYYETTRA